MKMESIEKIRFYLGSKAPRSVYHICVIFRKIYKKIVMPQRRKKYGELNPDKTFFVIRLFPPATGFLANYNYVLGYMHYAYNHGWIPVVDMQNYGTLYQETEPVNGSTNVWEYFFEQPYDTKTGRRYSLEEVYKSANVILSDASMELVDYSMNPDVIEWQRKMARLVPFNGVCQKYIDMVMKSTLPSNIEVIGVPTRGSEQKNRVIGHPIPITAKELVPILKDRLERWNDSNTDMGLFIKAEEQETIDFLCSCFSKVFYTCGTRITHYQQGKDMPASNAIKSGKYKSTLEYLTDIYILSQCNSIIGTMNNGLYTALLWNDGKYKNIEIIDKGIYK